jgi:phosphatidylglycerophosphatase A
MNGPKLPMEKTEKKFLFGNFIRRTGASMLYLGYFPFASGTLGSAVTVLGVWYLHQKYPLFFTAANIVYYWGAMIAVIAASILISNKSKEVFGSDDPPQIIIDELAGQFITFFLIPISLQTLIAGFVLFRFFDIVKPFPVYKMEEMDDGVGVVMDDVAAGVYANVSLLLLLAGYQWVKGYL